MVVALSDGGAVNCAHGGTCRYRKDDPPTCVA